MQPDLIVLDEFQRFTELLHGEGEAAELARKLFDAVDPDGNQAKVLLLSATPYRMLSLRDDDADAGDHYREFLDVLSFLFGEQGPSVRAELELEMRRYRLAMQGLPGSGTEPQKSMGRERRIQTTCVFITSHDACYTGGRADFRGQGIPPAAGHFRFRINSSE